MEAACVQSIAFSHPIPSTSPRCFSLLSRNLTPFRKNPGQFPACRPILRRRNFCSACGGADTLIAGPQKEENSRACVGGSSSSGSDRSGGDEFGDLKSWMHSKGLPPCKVVLKTRPSHDGKHHPIHYVAASEDLRAGDVAFSVPNALVVTLDRVLGNETVGESLSSLCMINDVVHVLLELSEFVSFVCDGEGEPWCNSKVAAMWPEVTGSS
ncbi:hypothetical protein ACLOJK_012034 [Asimina triloba]